MREYVIKRLLLLIPVLFIVSVVVFSIVHLTPGDPASVLLGEAATQSEIDRLRDELGLDRPLVGQYLHWLGGVMRLDFGYSYFMKMPVMQAIGERVGPSASLAVLAELLAVALALPLGVAAAVRRGSRVDTTLMATSLLGMSIPSFLLGLFLVLFFSVKMRWLPVAGYAPLENGVWAHLRYMILPALALGTIQMALIVRMTRTSMLEVLNAQFVKAARARGLKERLVIYRHALRNAFVPILTVIGQSFGVLIAGAVVVETIFNIPGLGQLIVNAVDRRDYAVIQGGVLFVTFLYLMINLTTDLLYGLIDPRIRYGHQ